MQARTWRGKVEIQRENLEVGHRLLLSVSKDYPEYPVEHVRNADLVAVAWCKAGRTAEARELVDSVRKRHGSTPEGEEVDEALTSALTRMKAPALLARAEEEDQDR